MKKYQKVLKAITFVMAFGVIKGQEFGYHRLFVTPTVQPVYTLDEKEFMEKIIAEYSSIEKNKTFLTDYARFCLEARKKALNSNTEYNEWIEGEKYIERVVKRILPGSGLKETIKVRIIRDASMNACAYEDGTIYVNIGLLANINSEAELAAVLGHELGHVVLHHNYSLYKSYHNYLNQLSIGGMAGGLTGLVIRQLARSSLSSHSVSNEANADKYAMERIQASGYTHEGFISVFQGFENQRKLYDSRAGFNNQSSYLKTHPGNEERIARVKEAFTQSAQKKSSFLTDSLYFIQLRQQCVDESIYILFNSLQFEDCIELSYKQHLLYPYDKFYLFFLGQSLKRLLLEKPELANKRFITYRYVIPPNHQKISAPAIAYSKFYKNKPAEFVYRQSIFYNLDHIYNLNAQELVLLPNKTLATNDTLEFINNEDALDYFNGIAKSLLCKICELNYRADTMLNLDLGQINSGMVEDNFLQLSKELKKYHEGRQEKNIFMISRYDQFYISYITLTKGPSEDHVSNIYSSILSNDSLKNKLVLPSDLLFNERNELLNYFEKIQDHLPDPYETSTSKFKIVNSKYFNCLGVFPELSACLNAHGVNKVNFLSIIKAQKSSGGYMSMIAPLYDYVINCYGIDLKNNTISKYTRNLGSANDSEILQASLQACSEINKLIAKENR